MDGLGFWLVIALIAAGGAVWMLLPLLRARAEGAAREMAPASASSLSPDMQVYRDQLREVETDLARGTVSAEEGTRLRAEIARRLLEADRKSSAPTATRAQQSGRLSVMLASLLVVLCSAGAIGLYLELGRPDLRDLPIAERLATADARMHSRPSQAAYLAENPAAPPRDPDSLEPGYGQLMTELRAAVDVTNSQDPTGLALLASNETVLGNFPAARAAQERLLAVKGESASAREHSTLADILIAETGGYVSPEAEEALIQALKRDPAEPWARYYTGLLFVQNGRFDRGFLMWRPLAEAPRPEDNASWYDMLRQQLPEIAQLAGVNYALPPEAARGPSADDIAAASELDETARAEMIGGMVDGLMARLNEVGGTAQEWARLIHALGVLGRDEEASAILTEARLRFADREADMQAIEAAAKGAGLAP